MAGGQQFKKRLPMSIKNKYHFAELNEAQIELKKKAKDVENSEIASAKAEADHLAAISNRDELMERLRSQTPEHLSKRLRDAQEAFTEASRVSIQAESSLSTSNERLDIIQGEVQKLERKEEESRSLAL